MDFTNIDFSTLENDLIAFRRERHSKPENAWNEYLTTCAIIRELERLGIPYLMGKEIHTTGDRYGLPTEEEAKSAVERALREGADPALVERMVGGYTGVVGVIDTGRPGPVTAIRFDIDCNDVAERTDPEHRPVREGFASQHPNLMHACGHDAHTSIGIGVARILMACKDQLCGKIKLIFQPGEEGGRGGSSIADSKVLDDVNYIFGGHVWGNYGTIAAGITDWSSSYKVDFIFDGKPAHAGAFPQEGKNALAAAATATLNLLGIARHSGGFTRVNVGVCQAGSGRNVIPGHAVLKAEVRGASNEINDYMFQRALTVAKAAADMHECGFSYKIMGRAADAPNNPELMEVAMEAMKEVPEVETASSTLSANGAGEDVTFLMQKVQAHGGKGTYLALGASQTAPNHNGSFDIDERVILTSAKVFSKMVGKLNGMSKS